MREIRVVAGAVVVQGQVLVARRPPGGPRGTLWELPGGKVEPGETDAEALQRELFEELDLTVEVGDYLGETLHEYPDVRVRLVGYVCRSVGGPPRANEHDRLALLDETSLESVEWAPADVPLLPALKAWLEAGVAP